MSTNVKRVAVLYNGWSHEAQLSAYPVIIKTLESLSFVPIAIDTRGDLLKDLAESKPDVVFPASHGAFHEDGKLQGLLEILGYKYVGSGVAASGVGMNKLISKMFFRGCGYDTPDYVLAGSRSIPRYRDAVARLGGRLIMKPVFAGASFGVCVVNNEIEYDARVGDLVDEYQDILIEEFVDGRGYEYSMSVIEKGGNVLALPICEIGIGSGIFDYSVKFTKELIREKVPADLEGPQRKMLQDMSIDIFTRLGCSGFARIDVILDQSARAYVLELNSLPGLLPTSIFPKACNAAGITYPEMIEVLIEGAMMAKPMEIERQTTSALLPEEIRKDMEDSDHQTHEGRRGP